MARVFSGKGRAVALSSAAVLALAAGLASPAFAQDSVSNSQAGLPGDALVAYTTTGGAAAQVRSYVLDLADITSSWGTGYRVGPLAKASSGGAQWFSHLVGAQAASNRFANDAPFFAASYSAWKAAGQGINSLQNTTPTDDGSGNFGTVNTAGATGSRFAAAFMEFGGGADNIFGNGDDENNIVAALASFDPKAPGRLFVTRVLAAHNRPLATGGATSTASFGLGAIDNSGVLVLSADGYGMTSGSQVSNKRYNRVNAAARNPAALNQISNTGAGDTAANSVLLSTNTATMTPALVPAQIAGRNLALGGDFASNYLFEGTAGALTPTTTHLPAAGQPRGPLSFSSGPFARLSTGQDLGVAGVLSRASGDTRTRGISLWGVNPNGSVDTALRLVLPSAASQIIDGEDGFDPAIVWAAANPIANHEFTNYSSQVSFRGGNGPVAMTVLANGDLLVAATVSATGVASSTPASVDNYLAVARVSAATGAVSWSIAAHTGGQTLGTGKAVLGAGPSGLAPIGRVVRYSDAFNGATNGPSISSPAMDRLGNLYFLATIQLDGNPATFTTALLKANLTPAGSYQLEKITAVGDVVNGANSQRPYQVQFMGVSDADSVDSGAIWSGNIVQDYLPRVRPDSLPFGSSYALGALVFRAKIVYDTNASGTFIDPTAPGGSGSDQAYNVALVLMPPFRPTDFNQDGTVNTDDISDYITAYFGNDPAADYNLDAVINTDDISDFITDYFGGV